jgi:hypothetical protein
MRASLTVPTAMKGGPAAPARRFPCPIGSSSFFVPPWLSARGSPGWLCCCSPSQTACTRPQGPVAHMTLLLAPGGASSSCPFCSSAQTEKGSVRGHLLGLASPWALALAASASSSSALGMCRPCPTQPAPPRSPACLPAARCRRLVDHHRRRPRFPELLPAAPVPGRRGVRLRATGALGEEPQAV